MRRRWLSSGSVLQRIQWFFSIHHTYNLPTGNNVRVTLQNYGIEQAEHKKMGSGSAGHSSILSNEIWVGQAQSGASPEGSHKVLQGALLHLLWEAWHLTALKEVLVFECPPYFFTLSHQQLHCSVIVSPPILMPSAVKKDFLSLLQN